ncbi:MAG: hypothetical protein GX818_07745 [Tissierellia bacterium]|nr:hypothetical protein [Tissierellia bacterium]
MNIGIKYCGGCNPHFDRSNVLNKTMELFKDDKFEYAKENNSYDIIIVINGCSRACSDHSSLRGNIKIFINQEADYLEAIDLILKHKNQK